MDQPTGIPVMLHLGGWKCLVVGGGAVAVRRSRSLVEAGAQVTVLAPEIDPAIEKIGATIVREPFDADKQALSEYALVVVATSNEQTNEAITRECDHMPDPPLVNRADRPLAGDLTFMSSHRDGPLTVAVHTGGASANAAARIRSILADSLDPVWGQLLALALPARQRIQAAISDPAKRTELLRRLTDDNAIQTLKQGGESGLKAFYDDIMKDLA